MSDEIDRDLLDRESRALGSAGEEYRPTYDMRQTLNDYQNALRSIPGDVMDGYSNILRERTVKTVKAGEDAPQAEFPVPPTPPAPVEIAPVLPKDWHASRGIGLNGRPAWIIFDDLGRMTREEPITTTTPNVVQPQIIYNISRPEQPPREVVSFKARTEALTDQERDSLDKLERDYVDNILKKVFKDARKKVVGITHTNLVPYEKRQLDTLEQELGGFKEMLQAYMKESASDGAENVRAREVLDRVGAINEWVVGNINLLLVGGPVNSLYYDGWKAVGVAAKSQREDISSDALDKKFAGKLKKENRSGLAQEIIRKQDVMYDIYRGIAAVHRSPARNRGEKLADDYDIGFAKREDGTTIEGVVDKAVARRRAKFVEKVFGRSAPESTFVVDEDFVKEWSGNTYDNNPMIHKGVKWTVNGTAIDSKQFTEKNLKKWKKEGVTLTKEVEYIETIAEVWKGGGQASNELTNILNEPGAEEKRRILIGDRIEITDGFVEELRKGKYNGKSVWINGVQWKIDNDTVKDLWWRVDSGDKAFVGKIYEVDKKSAGTVKNVVKANQEVALLDQIAPELENTFVMDSAPDMTDPVTLKLSLMLDDGTWNRLGQKGANVNQIITEFNAKYRELRRKHEDSQISELNQHIIETERVGLTYMVEAHELGWGFNYAEAQEGKTKVVKREYKKGSPHVATDMSSPFFWLKTDAENTSEVKPSSPLPMKEKILRQIIDHEPGWVPKWKKHLDPTWSHESGWVPAWKKALKVLQKKEDRKPQFREDEVWYTTVYEKGADPAKHLRTDVPAKFQLTMLDVMSLQEPSQADRRLVGGRSKVRPMDLVKNGREMSDIGWRKLNQEAQNKWYVILGKFSLMEFIVGAKPGKEFAETYIGDQRTGEVVSDGSLEKLNKDMSAALANLPEGDEYSKFLPYAFALYLGYIDGAIPGSAPGVRFDYFKRFKKHSEQMARKLGTIRPIGNPGLGETMKAKFENYSDQLVQIGLTHDQHVANTQSWNEY